MFKRWRLILRLLPYMRPYRTRAIALVVLTVLSALFALLQPWPMAFLLGTILGQDSFPGFLSFLDDWSPAGQIAFTAAAGFLFVLIAQVLTVVTRALDSRLELGMVLDFRSNLFAHIQRLSFQYHDRGMAGRYIYQVNYVAHDAGSIPTSLLPMAESVLTVIGMFAVTYLFDPKLALAASVVVPFVIFATRYYGRRIEPRIYAVRELEGDSMAIVHEKLSIIRVVVSFCRERYEHMRFREQAHQALDARVRLTIHQTVFSLGVALITAAGTAIVIFVGAMAVINGELEVQQLIVVLSYVAAVYQPLEQISTSLANLQQQLIQMDMVFDVLDTPPDVTDRPDAVALEDPVGRVELVDVAFHYDTRSRTIEEVTICVDPGEFVAIVGPTGAGKSTLVSLIPRFYDPQKGRVLLDGHDVRDLTLGSVRNAISMVMQEPILFMGTIADNIRYGRLDAGDDELIEAAKAANAHDFIMKLPEGYGTTVGERGARVSGGERQRIAVARAFLKNAPILILDEPTSSIDSRTEGVILEAIERLAEGRTTMMIAHRLSTIRAAGRIIVVDDGRIVEQGSHTELLARDGMYAELWRAQNDVDLQAPAMAQAAVPIGAARRPKVVVLGMMTKIPVAGVVWQTVHYLVGLERMGVEAYYVEAHARTPSMFMEREEDDGSTRAAQFIADVMHRFGFDDRWAFHALHEDGAVHGMTKAELARLYAEADVIINLHGGTDPLPEHAATGRLVFVETDPVQLQIELYERDVTATAYLEPHVAFFTFGENYGRTDCGLPVSDRFHFLPTRQPVVRDFWEPFGDGPAQAFTTIGNWRQPWREVRYKGETYHWTKHLEFLKFLDVPARTGQTFELALSSYAPADKEMLQSHGWRIAHALDFSVGLDSYRQYIGGSRGEFTVAKDQNVRLRTGWFSDRSATYLAAGRPVITQDTGFGNILPTGEGLFAFTTVDDVAAAVEDVNADYERHRRAARAIAREYFDHDAVLRPLLTEVGVTLPRRPAARPAAFDGFGRDLDLTVTRRHPTTLSPATVAAVLGAPVPHLPGDLPTTPPAVSIVVVTHDNLVFTRICLESVLANSARPDTEIIVVDNASTDMTLSYLGALAEQSPRFRVLRNDANQGFAAAANQGLARARGDTLVLLNNDTVVAPAWLDRLERHLIDPSVGMVGPLTNACPNEARIEVPYTTYGGFLEFAAEQGRRREGVNFEIQMLTMFCIALRRSVHELVGPLDERFEVGMFEDDDYAVRLRQDGLRLVCADDVVVHHFGEASFGKLVQSGDHARIFETNKARFEEKWQLSWEQHRSRPDANYLTMVAAIRTVVEAAVPVGATLLVVSKGDDDLTDISDRTVWHFPRDDDGGYAGWYAEDAATVAADLDRQLAMGARYLVFPASATWWFDFYEGLERHLEQRFDELDGHGVCRIFEMRETVLRTDGSPW